MFDNAKDKIIEFIEKNWEEIEEVSIHPSDYIITVRYSKQPNRKSITYNTISKED